jgi:succinyl-diaminopimelate desuccinylase
MAEGEVIDACVVGEPSSQHALGDMIKIGRRGSLNTWITVHGKQGHVAYPQLARNPVHEVAPVLARLVSTRWDEGNQHFPPTTWQVSNLHAGTGATNVIPGEAVVDFNFRFSTASTVEALRQRVSDLLDEAGLDWSIDWTLSARPFLTPPGALSAALTDAILAETGVRAELSTTGGTSDGRFISTICQQVVEFGPHNSTAHKIDESIDLACIEPLKNIYRRTLEALLR